MLRKQKEINDWIPDCCAGYGSDKSPELHIEGLPAETVSLAIVMDDLDHPIQPGFNHWVAWNIAPSNIIPGGLPQGAVVNEPIYIEQGIAYGRHCYRGPKPIMEELRISSPQFEGPNRHLIGTIDIDLPFTH